MPFYEYIGSLCLIYYQLPVELLQQLIHPHNWLDQRLRQSEGTCSSVLYSYEYIYNGRT